MRIWSGALRAGFVLSAVGVLALAWAAGALGADKIMYASDYPHWDSDFPDTVGPIRGRSDVSEQAKAHILGGTAARFYRLSG